MDDELRQLLFWRRLFILVLVVLLIPLAVIAFYSHAMSDDFVWATHQHHALMNGEGIIGFLKGCYEEAHWNYFDHHGEFTAILLGVLNPLAFGDSWYWITAYVMIGFLVFATFCCWRMVADGSRQEQAMADIAAAVSCIIMIEFIPRAVDMFYWFDGGVNYLPYFGMLAMMTGLFLQLCRKGSLSRRAMAVLCVVTYFGMGGNTITMVVNFMIVVGWGLATAWLYGRKPGERSASHAQYWRYYIGILVAAVAGVLTDLVAPGNAARLEDEGGNELHSAWEVITRTIDYAAASVKNQTTMMVLFLLALLIPLFWLWSMRIVTEAQESGRKTWFDLPALPMVAYAFFLQCAGYAPTIYMYGTEGEYRMEDVRFFYLVFYLLLLEFYFVGKTALLYRQSVSQGVCGNAVGGRVLTRFLAADVAMILIFGTAYYVLPSSNRNSMTSLSAAISLATGEAHRYDEQVKAQLAVLEDASTNGQDVTVTAVSDHPKVLYAWGLEMNEDPTNWINVAVAEFYDKASVTMVSGE